MGQGPAFGARDLEVTHKDGEVNKYIKQKISHL